MNSDRKRTYERLLRVFIVLKGNFPVADEEGKVEEVLDGLPEVVRVHDEPEEVHWAVLLREDALQLPARASV